MDEIYIRVVKVVSIKIVYDHSKCTRTSKIVKLFIFKKTSGRPLDHLISIIFTDNPFPGRWIIWTSDLRVEQKFDIIEYIACYDDNIGRLFNFLTCCDIC